VGSVVLRQWAYDSQLAKQAHQSSQGGQFTTLYRCLSRRTLEETLYMFISHITRRNFIGLKPFTEVRRHPNLPADERPLESLFIEGLRERIEVRHQRAFGFM
jgi:hypothetical protein